LKFGEQGCAQDLQPTALVLSTDAVVAEPIDGSMMITRSAGRRRSAPEPP
jgi:hypothetical protein